MKKQMKIVIPTFCNLHPDYKQDWKYRIRDFFLDTFYWPVKQFARKVIKIVQYIPILWNDYDWDYSYIYVLLKYKLERTYKAIDYGYELPKSKNKRLKSLKRCIVLLENLIKDDYCKQELNVYHKNNKTNWIKEKDGSLVSPPNKNWKELTRLVKKQDLLRKSDTKELFDLMAQNTRSWWS